MGFCYPFWHGNIFHSIYKPLGNHHPAWHYFCGDPFYFETAYSVSFGDNTYFLYEHCNKILGRLSNIFNSFRTVYTLLLTLLVYIAQLKNFNRRLSDQKVSPAYTIICMGDNFYSLEY